MTTHRFHCAQDGKPLPNQTVQRRRRRLSHTRRPFPKLRPGRFFRKLKRLVWIRESMQPVHLGESDWLLYRRRFNPYRNGSYKAQAYERGFLASKKMFPRPGWSPL